MPSDDLRRQAQECLNRARETDDDAEKVKFLKRAQELLTRAIEAEADAARSQPGDHDGDDTLQ
jgi:hypothetical protein